jgi:hypothetical protein
MKKANKNRNNVVSLFVFFGLVIIAFLTMLELVPADEIKVVFGRNGI